jgi:hypothetical protein
MLVNTNTLILEVIDKIMLFLQKDVGISKDFNDFAQFNVKNLSDDEKRSRTLMYLYSRKISGKSIFDYYLSKTLNLVPRELVVTDALKNAFIGVFQVRKISKEGFELYSIINEKEYSTYAIGTKTHFRGVGVGSFLYCCLCKIEGNYYVYDVRAVTGEDKAGGAYRFAVSKIIENPNIVFFDNDNKLQEIYNQINVLNEKFQECFSSDEVITTNKFADGLINEFNDYCENDNPEIKNLVANGIQKPSKYGYFPTKDFHYTTENFTKKSMAGFSSTGSEYDIGILFIAHSGLFVIPFYGTFCKIFEENDYQSIPNYKQCVNNFIHNEKISRVIFSHLAKKYDNFTARLNEITGTNLTLDQYIRKYKSKDLALPVISPAAILYSSKVFSRVLINEVEEDEKKQFKKFEKVGRNDLCPCGSGKKYKKCCMLKAE